MSDSVVSDHNAPSFQALYAGSFQQLTTSALNAQSLAFDSTTTLLKLFATQDTWIFFGTNPVAAAVAGGTKGTSVMLRGGFASYFGIPKNMGYKVAAIQSTTGGTLDILEGA